MWIWTFNVLVMQHVLTVHIDEVRMS